MLSNKKWVSEIRTVLKSNLWASHILTDQASTNYKIENTNIVAKFCHLHTSFLYIILKIALFL